MNSGENEKLRGIEMDRCGYRYAESISFLINVCITIKLEIFLFR